MDNLKIYNAVREVPEEAKKAINDGRLKGKTDINPMWRIKTLTEQFGVCGIGWFYEITNKRLEKGDGDTVCAFVDIALYIKVDGEWSRPIMGTGGSLFVQFYKNKEYYDTNDECFKMALTDALSVSCKALGIGADVYWEKDKTKYSTNDNKPKLATPEQLNELGMLGVDMDKMCDHYNLANVLDISYDLAEKTIKQAKNTKVGA